MSTVDFREDVRQDRPLKVDRDKGIVEGAKILGLTSLNNREYSPAFLEKRKGLYERRKVYSNHNRDGEPHPVEDVVGWFEDVVVDKGYRGNFHFLKTHPMAGRICEAAERNPELFGFSHHAHGVEKVTSDGRTIIEDIDEVFSVDLVSDPATTSGLKEGRKMTTPAKITVKAWREKQAAGTKLRKLGELWEEEGMADMAMVEPAAVDPAAAATGSDDQIWEAFKSAIMAAVDDEGLDIKATLKRIGEILKSYEKLTAADAPADALAADMATTEVRRLKEELAVRDLVDGLSFAKPEARTAFIESLIPLKADARKVLVEERKGQRQQTSGGYDGPRSGGGDGAAQQAAATTVFEDTEAARKQRLNRFRGLN